MAGAWSQLDVLAVMWSLGAGSTLSLFSVHDAALRARRLRAAQVVSGFDPATQAIFPKAWEAVGEGGGLAAVEQRWVAALPPTAVGLAVNKVSLGTNWLGWASAGRTNCTW